MSYLSTTENVGFNGIPQTIPDASCATQFKMAVEGVSGGCGSEVNMFIHDSSGDEQTYIPHLGENFFHTKFKIDPSELYTFNDSDVIANEITVSHTEDNFIFSESVSETQQKQSQSPTKDLEVVGISNGDVHVIKKEVVTNGHYSPINKASITSKEVKTANAKVQKAKSQGHKEICRTNGTEGGRPSVHSPKAPINTITSSSQGSGKVSITNANTSNAKITTVTKSQCGSETFLDVFKREQGVVEGQTAAPSTEKVPPITMKVPTSAPKKITTPKPSQPKPRKGRGPAVHEALQRIGQRRAVAVANGPWQAPGEEVFRCGPLTDRPANPFRQLDSSSDDDPMPDFESAAGPACVEESAAESRGARLALRRAALRRHMARAAATLRLTTDLAEYKTLASLIKKQVHSTGSSSRLPPQTVNHLLAMRGMSSLLSVQERRRLRECGWSGGDGGRGADAAACADERCGAAPLPCARHCLAHVTLAPEQRLYAACAAVFAGGERCKQPLLPLHDQTPLCAEHAWKRDNYEQMSRECKPQKAARKRVWAPSARVVKPQRSPRRPKRRRRLVPRRPPAHSQSLSEINVCSNSSYESAEESAVGGLSGAEYIPAGNSHELEVGQVPPDDILDPSVLSQIPDEAFTEFFNQAEGGPAFAESSELTAALEAVLDERALDTIADCVFTQAAPAPATASAPATAAAAATVPAPATASALAPPTALAPEATAKVPTVVSEGMSPNAPS